MKAHTPWWMTIVIVVLCLPLFATPSLIGMLPAGTDDTVKTLVTGYPIYVVASGILAWIVYPSRKGLAWILLILMALSHVAIYMLAKNPTGM